MKLKKIKSEKPWSLEMTLLGFQSGVWKLAENSLRRNGVTGPHTVVNSRQKEEYRDKSKKQTFSVVVTFIIYKAWVLCNLCKTISIPAGTLTLVFLGFGRFLIN